LLRTVADEFYIVHQGGAAPFDGDLEDYATWLAEADSAASGTAARKVQSADARRQRKRDEAERRNRLSPLRAAIASCESTLERLAKERARVQAGLDVPDVYAQSARARLEKLLGEQARLARETEKMEARWLESTEQLEVQLRKLNTR
jgi:ATP-binding cassette, subfamily F, member 3